MKKIGIIGHFDDMAFDGQTVKTKELYSALKEVYGEEQFFIVSLSDFRKNPVVFFSKCLKAVKECENIIILPAHNAVRVLVPFFSMMKRKYTCKLFYSVIGGWLPEFLEKRKYLLKGLKDFNGIWVETTSMKSKLIQQGLENIYVVPNFKDLKILSEEELVYNENPPFKLCTFSRVMKEKGIEDAINAVREINEETGKIKFTLDIYGKVDLGYVEEFEKIQQTFPEYIMYCGAVESDKSVDVLKEYNLLLFPTRFKTEGIPGTIIDSYCAGVPVLASKWDSFSDIVKEKQTGMGFVFEDYCDFKEKLKLLFDNFESLTCMKKKCIEEAEKFSKENVMKKIENILKE